MRKAVSLVHHTGTFTSIQGLELPIASTKWTLSIAALEKMSQKRQSYVSNVDPDIFGPSLVQSAAVSSDVDQWRVFFVVDQHFPAAVVLIHLCLRLVDLQVQIVEHSGRGDV